MAQTLKDKLEALPEPHQKEVENFVDSLLERGAARSTGFNFAWSGGLRELREKTTSVALQHKASEWR